MFVDGRTIPADASLEADVCIVGAGPAGIAVALQLASNARVLILESGGITPEILAKDLDWGRSIGYPYHNLMFTRARAFGGTSSRWHLQNRRDPGWIARPLDPLDFEARPSLQYSGWPFAAPHLDPFYKRAHLMSGLGAETYEIADWERLDMRRLPLAEDRVLSGIVQLGMSSFARYREQFATLPGVIVVYHSTVVEIESSGDPADVHKVRAATGGGRRFSVGARYVVLAAGGIENPRLLLLSRRHQSRGLGNGNDLVGRYFMEHPSARIGYLRPARRGLVDEARLYDAHREGSVLIQGLLTLSPEVVRREGLRNACFFLLPRTEAFVSEGVRSARALLVSAYRRPRPPSTLRHLLNVVGNPMPVVEAAAGLVTRGRQLPTLLVVRTQAEQAPDPASRIMLGSERDRFGARRVVLDWRLGSDDVESIRRSEDLLDEEFRRQGLGRIERRLGEENPAVVLEGHHHHMGTTRMHADPKHGVVDADGRVHGTRNLYVTGSSVFPTAGYINPTLTVVALGIRLGDHLRRRLGTG